MVSTSHGWSLFPGFPLTSQDYDPLCGQLARAGVAASWEQGQPVLAHSRGCLDALAQVQADVPLVLLAPSHPGRVRRGRELQARILAGLAHVPWLSGAAARQLRRRTFSAFHLEVPAGPALSLGEAAERLRTRPVRVEPRTRCWVVTSPSDPRHAEQLALADLLGAGVERVEGGHMFPITRPAETADVIAAALRTVQP